MAEPGAGSEVPEGAAVFPLIPEELGIHPLLLAVLHAVVFVDGSTEDVIDPEAAEEVTQFFATYLHRLQGPALRQVREDMETLLGFARQEKWPKAQVEFLKAFLTDYGIGVEAES
jgi:hypothetical protein